MTVAREIMSPNPEFVKDDESLADAAKKMRDLDIGMLPVCGTDNQLKGVVTDRDIVVKCIAAGGRPEETRVIDLTEGKPVTIGADDSIEEAIETMERYQVRRLPVIDGDRLVGMVSQADIARNRPPAETGGLVETISEGPGNN